MKKRRLSVVYLFVLALVTMSVNFLSGFNVSASEDKLVPISSLDAWKVVNWGDASSTYVNEGVKMTIEGNTTGSAWQKGAKINWDGTLNEVFDIKEGRVVNFKFSLGLVDANATSNNGDQFDIIAYTSGGAEIGRIRVFFSAGGVNNGNHPIDLYEGGNWTNYAQDLWMFGDATLDSEFNIAFSKENLFMAAFNGDPTLRRLDNANNDFKNAVGSKLADVKSVYFEIKGDNGFNKNVDIIVREINGQSLANDGVNFVDTEAPRIFSNNTLTAIEANEEYELPAYAVDLLDKNITYNLTFGEASSDSYHYEGGKKFTLLQNRLYEITLHALDSAGNEAIKTFVIQATLTISPPTFENVPTLSDINTEVGKIIVFDAPIVVESTGIYTLVMNIYVDVEGSPAYVVNPSAADGKFHVKVPYNFPSGDYGFEYEATNSGGTAKTTMQIITVTVADFKATDLITGAGFDVNTSSKALVDYVDTGLRIRTSEAWTRFNLGNDNIYNAKYGIELVFTVPRIASSGVDNSLFGGRASFVLYNPTIYDKDTNPSGSLHENGSIIENYMMYGVWVGAGTNDSPTNIYIRYNEEMHDITDTGWIKTNNVDNRTYRMSFDLENYFMGERESGMTIAETEADNKARTHIKALLDIIGTSSLGVAIELGGFSGENYELVINKINGQDFANVNGEITTVNDAQLEIGIVPNNIVIDTTTQIEVYGKDMISNAKLQAIITDPDGSVDTVEVANWFSFTPTKLGQYQLKFEITGANGNKVESQVYNITSKTKYSNIEVELDGSYESNFNVNDEVTVIGVVDNEEIDEVEIIIKKPDNSEVTLAAGSKFKFDKPGVYTIRYIVKDNAEPTPNEFTHTVQINVIDEVDPVVDIPNIKDKGTVGKEITIPAISISDDSEVDVIVKLIKPDNTSTQIQTTTSSFKFTPDQEGVYKIEVTATDLYDNTTVKVFEVTVEKASTSPDFTGFIIGGVVVLLVVAGIYFFVKKRK